MQAKYTKKMNEFKKRHSLSSQLLSMLGGVVALLLLVVVAFFAARAALDMYGKFAEAAAARASTEAELAELQGRFGVVKAQVDALDSPRGLEAAVRERYGVARQGESELDIVRQSSSTDAKAPPTGLWDRLWHLLFVW